MDFGSIIGSAISGIASIFGADKSSKAQEDIAKQNVAMQEQFAQHGVQWRAEDATAAQNETGINRLALLGVPTNSFSNVVGATDAGAGISRAGQDIGRAIAAATAQPSRAEQLEAKLTEAKIANVNADTIGKMAAASSMATKLGQPATARVPMPTPDPRGPVEPLVSRFRDPRTGDVVWLPSKEAASPLQTLAASPANAALAVRGASEMPLSGYSSTPPQWDIPPETQGAVYRSTQALQAF